MARAALGLALLAFVVPATGSAAPLVPRELASLARTDHALLQLDREGARRTEQRLRRAGGVLVSAPLRIWRLPSATAQRLVPRLALEGALRDFEPDHLRAHSNHGNAGDSLVPQQWWLSRVGADRVDPPGPGKPVTVIDTGLDLAHPEFAGRANTTALNRQRLIGRREFHGTAVASVVAAPANGIGVVGVYPQAVLHVWDASPDGVLTSADVIAGLSSAAQRGPGVISLSIGGFFQSRLEEDAILHAVQRGSIVVAAVGNEREDGSPPAFPASSPHVLTVASTSGIDQASMFSSEAPGVDIAAPGEDIPVARPGSPTGYSAESGTSFSAPIVAGAVAWVWTARPQLDATQVFELIRRSARDTGAPGRDRDTGFGLLDIPAALARPAPAPDPLEPNDTVAQVRAGGVFAAAKPPLTDPARGRAALTARLDVADDPSDVYRVWLPGIGQVTSVLRSGRDVQLQILGSRPPGVTAQATQATGRRTVVLTNRARRGAYVYLGAHLRANARAADATYTLSVATRRAPR